MNYLNYLKEKGRILAVAVFVALVLAGVVYYFLKSGVKTSYQQVEAKKGDIQKVASFSGQIKPVEAADLAFEKTGKVASISVRVGDQVKKGQQLAILDQTDYSDQVNEAMTGLEIAKAGLDQAEANLKKEKKHKTELTNTHASKYTVDVQKAQIRSAEALVDIQKAQIASAEASLRSARDQHEKIVLISPIDGIVSKKDIEVGEIANPTSPAFSVISQDTFKIEAEITQKDLTDIKVGQKAEISFDSCRGGEKIESAVSSVDPAEINDNGNSVYKATFEIGKAADCLHSGVTANIDVITAEEENVLIIPSASVIRRDGKYFVLMENSKKGIEEKEIEVGLVGSDNQTEVLSGINEGDRIIEF